MNKTRIEILQQWIKKNAITALLVEDPIDLFYLTTLKLSVGRLCIEPEKASLLVDSRYLESAKLAAPCPVYPADELRRILSGLKAVAFDSAFVSYDRYTTYKKEFPEIDWIALPKPLRELRLYKSEEEITALRKAARLAQEGHRHIVSLLAEGAIEKELSFAFELFCRKKGASALSFEPIIAFGENSAYPHYRAGNRKLEKDQIVLIDVGVIFDNYCSDLTRVHFFGRPHPELQRFYALARKAQERVIAAIRPGISFGDLDKIAREFLAKQGVASLFIHNLGHGIGLEVHEPPQIKAPQKNDRDLQIQVGMAFTVEPGLYKPGLGGVRYEDTILVTEKGVEVLTRDL